jgi:hypothetical protein
VRAPDFEGPAGRAWRVALPAQHERADTTATLAQWLLTIPSAHPAWHSYALAVVHLREIPGVRPAVKRYPEAAYELLVLALDPDKPLPDPDVQPFRLPFLTPPNLVEQFHGVTDEQAVQVAELLARGFVDGHVNPDTDWRSHTQGVLRTTVEHFATGKH